MKELLEAVKKELHAHLAYIRSGDVFVTPSENYLPAHAKFPCIGLKDGAVTRVELSGGMIETRLAVALCVFVSLPKEEASITGDASGKNKGVLDIAGDIHAALDENLLDIEGMIEAFSPLESASEMFGTEEESIQRKLITYEYVKQEDRP